MKTMKKTTVVLAALLALPMFSTTTIAQEAARYADDARYLNVVFVAYKPGKAAEAYGIIRDHFMPAGEAAGTPGPVIVHFQTGQYDAAFHWRLENGTGDLEWRISPNNAAFRRALAEQEGGEEAAQALMDRYNSLIARTTSVIGHRHVPEGEE